MKTTIVLGLMASGSGVVHDYLSSRDDFQSPFGTNEFKLCSDPLGLHNLYLNCYKNFSFFNPSNAFHDFLDYTKKIENYDVYEKHGVPKKLYKKNFNLLSKRFADKVTKIYYNANPEFSNFKINLFQNYYLKLKKKRYDFFKVRLPVSEEKFLYEARLYIRNIILNNLKLKKLKKNSNIVLNQAANIFDPIASTQYFEKTKIVIVKRDPRDMFASMKHRKTKGGPHKNVITFIDWYKRCFDNKNFKKNLKHKSIYVLKLEKFLNNFDEENKKLCKFLRVKNKFNYKKKLSIKFDINFSKKNLYKSKHNLTKYEFNIISSKLQKFLQW